MAILEELTSSDDNRVRSFNNGDSYSYVGEYRDGKIDGRGVYKWVDGGSYEGEFKGGMKHSRGVYVSVTGDTYTGEYKKERNMEKECPYWHSEMCMAASPPFF